MPPAETMTVPLVGATLVLERDGHVTTGIQVAPGDVYDGSSRNRPSVGRQVKQSGNLWDCRLNPQVRHIGKITNHASSIFQPCPPSFRQPIPHHVIVFFFFFFLFLGYSWQIT